MAAHPAEWRNAVTVAAVPSGDSAISAELEAWVLAQPRSTPFHRPSWVQAVAQGTAQTAIMLVARNGAGSIAGLLPLTLIRSLLFGKALVSVGFSVDGGILADDPAVADALAIACWAEAERHRCTTAELRGGLLPSMGWNLREGTYLNFSRALASTDAEQLAQIPRKHRAEVRKGLDKDLHCEIGDTARLRAIHYRLYAESVHRLGTPVFPRRLFDEVLDRMGPAADICLVSHNGVPLSSILSLYHQGVCMPYWQGASGAARAMRSNEVAYFRLMSHARERGCHSFDFGRSKMGTGPAAWKKSWGWEGTPLTYAVRSTEGQEARDINPLSPQYQRKVELWKKLPLRLATLIGPHIARGLG
ncbi:MAG: FemAB family PEP-CTERM system-associated protein [Sphingobium sp.]|uniref:FemAB family XrtA/PEP-CTERM system-associated protein n=1 Tax=Sphingobium sp. TaxID=1912891 RepID=UPI0029B5254F|nr:FemAB family XrtA/PEP-CTERM system-associated protein [Sphingobium sp.]MDX3908959.1 FemAB family PEP-CTERM system-associated protein [Sphingobium sp.]